MTGDVAGLVEDKRLAASLRPASRAAGEIARPFAGDALRPPPEPPHRRACYMALMLLVTAGFFLFVYAFHVAAHGGGDQNGYLVGGKLLARTGTMKLAPTRLVNAGEQGERIRQFDPHQFVGSIWVGVDLGTDNEHYYPKYPLGLPAIYAAALLLSARHGHSLAFLISPIFMALAVLGTYLLIRQVARTFLALMGAVVFAGSPVTLALANNPNSHASTVFLVVWGMFLLLLWWKKALAPAARGDLRAAHDSDDRPLPMDWPKRRAERSWALLYAAGAGFLLGYAVTIRYTEATLLLPMALVALYTLRRPMVLLLAVAAYTGVALLLSTAGWWGLLRGDVATAAWWRPSSVYPLLVMQLSLLLTVPVWWALVRRVSAADLRALIGPAALALAWLLPVGTQLIYNWASLGALTGYDPTNESLGFGFAYGVENWEVMLRHLNTNGLFFVFPLGAAGMVCMFWWNWRLAALLLAWVLPCMIIYTFYYWAPDTMRTPAYLRFFLTILPALVLAAMWMVDRIGQSMVLVPAPQVSQSQQVEAAGALRGRPGRDLIAAAGVAPAVLVLVGLVILWPLYSTWKELGSLEAVRAVDADLVRSLPVLGWAVAAGLLLWMGSAWWRWAAERRQAAAGRGQPAGEAPHTASVVTAGVLAAVSISVHLDDVQHTLEDDQIARLTLYDNASQVTAAMGEGSVVFSGNDSILRHLQFVTDHTLYLSDSFTRAYLNRLHVANPQDPQVLDPHRRLAMQQRLRGLSDRELLERQREIIEEAHQDGQRVFLIVSRPGVQAGGLQQMISREPAALDPTVRRLAPANRFTADVVAGWPQYNPRPVVFEPPSPTGPRRRVTNPRIRQTPQPMLWQVIEIRPRGDGTEE